MSEYQRMKARALEIQREKERELQHELARRAEQDKAAAKAEAERKKRLEETTMAARRVELMRANAALTKAAAAPSAATYEYNPFAEDAVGPSKSTPRTTSKPVSRSGGAARGPAAAGGAAKSRTASTSGGGGGAGSKAKGGSSAPKAASGEPLALSRKEKAALKLQRELKGTAADAGFSVRDMLDGPSGARNGGGRASGSTSSSRPASAPASRGSPAAPPRKTMQQRKTSVDVSSLRKLCPDRDSRDRRTVDEIQRDIRARKGGPAGAPASGGRDLRRSDARDGRDNRDNRDRDRVRDRGRDRGRDRDRDRDRDRRRRSPSSDYSLSPPRKRSRSSPPEASRSAVSAMIQGMFSRGRPLQQYADDDSDGSDMEAGLSDVEMEEKRALRIARREDDEAEREENVRREAKERMKRARK